MTAETIALLVYLALLVGVLVWFWIKAKRLTPNPNKTNI